MKVLDIYWLECDTCEDSVIQVTTEMGDEEWFHQGDTAICKNCKNSGVIENIEIFSLNNSDILSSNFFDE